MININKQNNRFNIKLRVFELNFIYLALLNFISLLTSNIKTTIHIFAKKKFKEIIIKPFNLFIASLLMCQFEKNHLKSFRHNKFLIAIIFEIKRVNSKNYFLISSK